MSAQTINLLSLARSLKTSNIANTDLTVTRLEPSQFTKLEQAIWLLVLEGELIIDFETGDFQILKQGDSIELSTEIAVSYQPLKETIVLSTNLR
ncbi:MAG TPA: hypothetical protein ENK21_11040 [Trueperaceae bacterium]|nr:hypothetical protein [Trueperaceae bacterium]